MSAWVLRMLGDPPVRLLVNPRRAFRIGRDTEADLCLDDKLVSRRHAELVITAGGTLEVHDLGSRNGTRLNGKAIVGAAAANPGDEIRIGSATLLVDGPQAPSSGSGRHAAAIDTARRSTPPAAASVAAPPVYAAAAPPEGEGRPDLHATIPGYDLLSEVTRGRTGVVYRARNAAGQEMLVKVLDPALASSENALARFEAEATALSRIDHPNIVRLHEISATATRHFYSMAWSEGRTLEALMRAGRLEPRDATAIAAQVARGLGMAHATGVVHRDIAPASILVTPGGVAKLFDFSFVKTHDEMPSFTNFGDVVGDLRYSSPEQAGNPRAVDHRSDFYCLGATLYHAVAGRPPLEGKNYLDTYHKLVSEAPPPLGELVPEARPRLVQAAAKLLAKSPEERFQNAAEVAQALAEALLEAVIAARKTAPPPGAGIGADFRGVELLELVQVIESRRATGVLTVIAPGIEGEILFRGGEVSAARVPGEERLLPATETILDLPAGTFAFRGDPHVAAGPAGPTLKPHELALEALRRRSRKESAPAGR